MAYLADMGTDGLNAETMREIRNRVLCLVKNGAFDAAVTLAADFVRRNPDLAASYGLLAQTEEVAGYTRAAIKSVSKAINLAPQEPSYLFHRGRLYMQINAAVDSLNDMTRVLELVKVMGNADHIRAVISYRDEALRRVQYDQELVSGRHRPPPVSGQNFRAVAT